MSGATFWFYFYSNMQIKINLMNQPDLQSLPQTRTSAVLLMLPAFSVVRHLPKYIIQDNYSNMHNSNMTALSTQSK